MSDACMNKLKELKELLHKINNMNTGDFEFYARMELRHAEEDLNENWFITK